jgi:hypothetical protein
MALAITLGAALICGSGWFLLSRLVMNEAAGDAAGEALGVAFGVLIVASVIGALRSFARRDSAANGPAGSHAVRSSDSGEDSENPS